MGMQLTLGGILTTAFIGAAGWVVFAFVGTPLRQFWSLRGDVIHAMNRYVRYLIGRRPISDAEIFAFAVKTHNKERDEAAAEFARLGHALVAFWTNELLAMLVAKYVFRIDGLSAGRMLLVIAGELDGTNVPHGELPSRDDVLDALRVSERQ